MIAERSSRLALSERDCSGQLVLGTSPIADRAWSGELRGLAVYAADLTPAQVRLHFTEWLDGGQPTVGVSEAPVAVYTFSEHQERAIHNQAGSGPDLYIPKTFLIPHKPLLLGPWNDFRWNRDGLEDIAINVAGFIPLGGFLCSYLSLKSRHAAVYTILAGTTVSLIIEILQAYLPSRTSSWADVMMNMFGTALGVALCSTPMVQDCFARRGGDKAA